MKPKGIVVHSLTGTADKEKPKDTTVTTGKLPDTGLKIGIVLLLMIYTLVVILELYNQCCQ